MAEQNTTLESLTTDGRNLLSVSHPSDAHHEFERWADNVARWLDEKCPDTGLSAQWSGLPMSLLVVGNEYDSSYIARKHFNQVVATRLKWLGSLGQAINDARKTPRADTHESDSVFSKIIELLDDSLLPHQYKVVVRNDVRDAQNSYGAAAYKACVVMLGAALEGIMLGTLQRSDVITHFAASSAVPGPIRRIGSRHPGLADKIGNELSFEDYKVCIHDLIPGSHALGVDNIQDFRNAIHPWKSIREPLKYGAFDRSRALHYLASFEKIVEALHEWTP